MAFHPYTRLSVFSTKRQPSKSNPRKSRSREAVVDTLTSLTATRDAGTKSASRTGSGFFLEGRILVCVGVWYLPYARLKSNAPLVGNDNPRSARLLLQECFEPRQPARAPNRGLLVLQQARVMNISSRKYENITLCALSSFHAVDVFQYSRGFLRWWWVTLH